MYRAALLLLLLLLLPFEAFERTSDFSIAISFSVFVCRQVFEWNKSLCLVVSTRISISCRVDRLVGRSLRICPAFKESVTAIYVLLAVSYSFFPSPLPVFHLYCIHSFNTSTLYTMYALRKPRIFDECILMYPIVLQCVFRQNQLTRVNTVN